MDGEKKRIEVEKLPFFYRLILKVPCPNVDFLPEVSKGIFWAIIVPIFMVLESYLILYLLYAFRFPLNYVVAAAVPSTLFLLVARVTVERQRESWITASSEQGLKWNLDKNLNEYFQILEKKKSKKTD